MVEVNEQAIRDLKVKAQQIRKDIVRMLAEAGSGHPGGSLSSVEIVTALFFHVLRLKPEDPNWPDRDRFILSKGHAAPLLYAALAERGFFPREELLTLRKLGTRLQGHPAKEQLPGVEASTGSLGQGLSMGLGTALAAKLDQRDYRVYVLLGDGECEEGQVWEAAMAAAHYKADNLTTVLDYNGLQIDGPIEEVMSPLPFPDKWRAFGWAVRQVDGHDIPELIDALNWAAGVKGQPSIIIAKTVKGKGVSFMEDLAGWHGKAPDAKQAAQALDEIGVEV
jgi:transketolase